MKSLLKNGKSLSETLTEINEKLLEIERKIIILISSVDNTVKKLADLSAKEMGKFMDLTHDEYCLLEGMQGIKDKIGKIDYDLKQLETI